MRALVILSLVFLEGCCLFRPAATPGTINRRYYKIDSSVKRDDGSAPIEVIMRTAMAIPVPDTGKTVFNLDGRGQAALLSKINKPSEAADLLNAKYQIDKDDPSTIDITKPKITVVLTARLLEFYASLPHHFSVADRLEYLRIKFTLDGESRKLARFASWDKIATQYGQVNLGTIGFGTTKGLTISPSIPLFAGGTSGALSAGSFSTTSTTQEQDTLQQRLTTLNGVLQDDLFVIEEHGNAKWPVDGNTSLNLSMNFFSKDELGYFMIDGLKAKGQYSPPSDLQPVPGQISFPRLGSLFGTLTIDYGVRHIVNGADTYTEGDDEVEYVYGKITQKNVRLMLQRDVETSFYGLVFRDGVQLQIMDTLTKGVGLHRPLFFRSFKEANDFNEWLHDQLPKLKGKDQPLKVGGYELYYLLPGQTERQLVKQSTDISSMEVNVYTVPKKKADAEKDAVEDGAGDIRP